MINYETNQADFMKLKIMKTLLKSLVFIAIIVCSLIVCSFVLYGQHSGGGYAASWFKRDFSARTLGLAGAFTAIADDPNAIYYNPAGLSDLANEPTFFSSVGMLGLGRTNSTFAWGQAIVDNTLGFGIALNNLHTGTFTARDIHGHSLGEYSNYQYAIAASASYKVAYSSFGVTTKYLVENLHGAETVATGYSVDFGALFNVLDILKVGVQVQNASGFMFWNTAHSDIMNLPWVIKIGTAYSTYTSFVPTFDRSTVTGEMSEEGDYGNILTIGFDFSYTQYSVAPQVTIGAEYQAHQYLTFRGGIGIYGDVWGKPQLFPMNNWGAGISIYPDIDALNDILPFEYSIDYTISRELLNTSGINHYLGINIRF